MGDSRFAMAPSHISRMPVASRAPVLRPPPPGTLPTPAPPALADPALAAPAKRPAAAVADGRTVVERKRPYHVGVALGLTAGIYAGSLAAVSMLQFEHDRGLIADRQPVSDAIELLGRSHDQMAASLQRAGAAFTDASTRYGELATGLEALHADVVGLSDQLATINKLAAIDASGLGGAIRRGSSRLPIVSKSPSKSGSKSAPPPSNGTTGASGAP